MWNKVRRFLILSVSGLLCTTCSGIFNEDDYDIEQFQLQPEIALPLAYGSLAIDDLLDEQDSEFIKVYPDGLVYLEYDQTLTTRDVRDLITVDDKTLSPRTFPLPTATLPAGPQGQLGPPINEIVDLDYSPQKFTEVAFKSGSVNFTINRSAPTPNFPFEIEVSMPGFTKNGLPFLERISNTGSISLAGYIATMTDNTFALQLTLFKNATTAPVNIPAGSSISISLSWTNMDYTYVKGFMGVQTTGVITDVIKIEAFGSSLDRANVSFAEPKIDFIVTNEYGIPLRVNFSQLVARKNGTTLPIVINSPSPAVTVNSPTTLGASASTTVSVTNAKELLDFAPDEFVYGVSGTINANPPPVPMINFLTDTSKIKVNMRVEVPLFGHASGIVLSDTVDLDLKDVDGSTIESASLRAKVTNEIPLDANLQLYLVGSNGTILDSLIAPGEANIIKGSQVNAAGELQSPGLYEENIELDKSKLNKIFSSTKMIIRATVSTSRGTSSALPDVKFKTQYKMNVNFGLRAKVNIISKSL